MISLLEALQHMLRGFFYKNSKKDKKLSKKVLTKVRGHDNITELSGEGVKPRGTEGR